MRRTVPQQQKANNGAASRSFEGGKWMRIHRAVSRSYLPEFGPIPYAVYGVLSELAGDSAEQTVTIEQKALARMTRTSRASVQRAQETLIAAGLIEVTESERQHVANTYRLLMPSRLKKDAQPPHTEAPKPAQPPHTEAQVLKTNTTTEISAETKAPPPPPRKRVGRRAIPPWRRTQSRIDLVDSMGDGLHGDMRLEELKQKQEMKRWTEQQWHGFEVEMKYLIPSGCSTSSSSGHLVN